jgi:hypothetical protein
MVISQRPCHSAGIRMIGKKARIEFPLALDHFPGKAALFTEVVEKVSRELTEANHGVLDGLGKLPPEVGTLNVNQAEAGGNGVHACIINGVIYCVIVLGWKCRNGASDLPPKFGPVQKLGFWFRLGLSRGYGDGKEGFQCGADHSQASGG